MIASHSDADNIGGLPEVMNNIKVKNLYAPKSTNTTAAYKKFCEYRRKKKKLTIKTAKAGVKLPVKGVNAQLLVLLKLTEKQIETTGVLFSTSHIRKTPSFSQEMRKQKQKTI